MNTDDWFGIRATADEIKVRAARRNEGVAQIIYEDEQVFRYFTYRWCPSHFKNSEDKDHWMKTLRTVCGMPNWKKVCNTD